MLRTKSERRFVKDKRKASKQLSVGVSKSVGHAFLTIHSTRNNGPHSYGSISAGKQENKQQFNRSRTQTLRSQLGIKSLMNTKQRQAQSKRACFFMYLYSQIIMNRHPPGHYSDNSSRKAGENCDQKIFTLGVETGLGLSTYIIAHIPDFTREIFRNASTFYESIRLVSYSS